jgi:hypothetical protein
VRVRAFVLVRHGWRAQANLLPRSALTDQMAEMSFLWAFHLIEPAQSS